jgi:hypothetical protein
MPGLSVSMVVDAAWAALDSHVERFKVSPSHAWNGGTLGLKPAPAALNF